MLLMLLVTLLITIAQYSLKTGLSTGLMNGYTFLGALLYAIGSFVMILAFKGGDVSALYPIIATSYIWVTLVSFFILHEGVHLMRWVGIFVIITGITFVGFGSRGPHGN